MDNGPDNVLSPAWMSHMREMEVARLTGPEGAWERLCDLAGWKPAGRPTGAAGSTRDSTTGRGLFHDDI